MKIIHNAEGIGRYSSPVEAVGPDKRASRHFGILYERDAARTDATKEVHLRLDSDSRS